MPIRITSSLLAWATFSALLGCATEDAQWRETAYGSWTYSRDELELLPAQAKAQILALPAVTETETIEVLIRTATLNRAVPIEALTPGADAVLATVDGATQRIPIARITEIQSIRAIRTAAPRDQGSDTEGIGEALILAPLIPLAVVSFPLLRAMELDAGKNAADNGKALQAYGQLSKQELLHHLGPPAQQYACDDRDGGHDVWVYPPEQVLRGARALFIHRSDGRVYYTSYNTTFFQDSCMRLTPGSAP